MHTPTRSILLTLTLAACLAGCEKVKTSDKDIQEIAEKAVVEATADPTHVLVDVRKPEHYDAGHIAGAVNIFLPTIKAGDRRLANAKQIIVYGDGWTDALAPAGAKRLLAEGYSEVYLFRGGLEVWRASGNPIVESGGVGEQRPETGK